MFLSKTAIGALALTFFASAFPILEENLPISHYESYLNTTRQEKAGELQGRAKITGLAPVARQKKGVVLDGKYATDIYRSGTDVSAWKNRPVKNIMESWQEGTKKMRGPFVAVKGKKALVNVLTYKDSNLDMAADHIFEAQTITQFLTYLHTEQTLKWSLAKVKGVFLANHKLDYTSETSEAAKLWRETAPDYSKDVYYGSLLQHMMAELGSLKNPDRMALLSGGTNIRKGIVWGKLDSKVDVEVVYDLVRINDYMIRVKDGFCATLDGIYNVLQKFHEGRMGDPIESLCDLFDETKITPRATASGSGSDSGVSSDPSSDPSSSDKGSIFNPNPSPTYIDKDFPKLKGVYAQTQDYRIHEYFVTFMRKNIEEVGINMQKNFDATMKTVKIPTGGDALKGFKVNFPTELLKCKSLIVVPKAKAPKRQASNSKKECKPPTSGSSPKFRSRST